MERRHRADVGAVGARVRRVLPPARGAARGLRPGARRAHEAGQAGAERLHLRRGRSAAPQR